MVGPDACGSCHRHAAQTDWWRGDAHSRSAEPLLQRRRKAVEIATLYYGRPASDLMVKGGSVCMGCHGTGLTGEEMFETAYGVSCERCHGPAGQYERAHQEASEVERRRLGMVDLGAPATRARVCSGCHYVTDRRLLSSGHPAGTEGFDLADRSSEIDHWERAQPSAGALSSAYRAALAARGPVPSVRVAKLDPAAVRSAAGAGAGRGSVVRRTAAGLTGPAGGYGAPPLPSIRPSDAAIASRPAGRSGAALELAPLPEDAASRPLDELLLLVKKRVDALYEATGGDG